MLLRDISAGLRLQKITIEEDLKGIAFFVPEHILHYFAVDCAERALGHIPEDRRGELFRKAKDLLETRKRWIEGDVSDQELASDREAYRASDLAYERAAERAAFRASYRASYRASEWAAYRAAEWAAFRAAEWASDLAYDLASEWAAYRAAEWAADRGAERADERKIQAIRLAEMIEEYLEALSLLVRTLEAYRLKLPIALELWKQEGEEVLF
jgi:hypothetical protein